MNTFGNIAWLILGGILIAFLYFVSGLVLCVTIIGIPLGLMHFRIAIATIFPFGKQIR